MGYHPRVETNELGSFLTTRSRNSELWFINNPELEKAILGYVAKFTKRYSVKLYAMAIEGNHMQAPADFPKLNRAHFMRDLNSCVARAVPRYAPKYQGGRFWGRRYSQEFVPGVEDVKEQFFYTVLQPVKDGLVEKISDYPGYNCFHDAAWGVKREYKVCHWAEYNAAKRHNPSVGIKDFIEVVTLEYARIPGYEDMPQKDYAHMLEKELEERRSAIVRERLKNGLGFVGRSGLLKAKPGSLPKNTKRSDINTHRPRVLSICNERRARCRAWYFDIYTRYKAASKEYRNGNRDVVFPEGTYPPILLVPNTSPP